MNKHLVSQWFQSLQDDICRGLEECDGTARFEEEKWNRPGGGGGRTRIIQGKHIEKGGVNFSAVEGELSSEIAKKLQLDDDNFFATGVSIVLHPSNPLVPIIHMNVRYFETGENTWWFGGGIDVTPHYIDLDDAHFFHSQLKSVCDKHDENYYSKFKKWADDYFFIRHRNETRGIGGIFYDKLGSASQESFESVFAFTKDVGQAFVPIYSKLFLRHFQRSFTEKQKEWQLIRRGRYVEFNLVWDRGTKFGLETNGRTESILMSLPKEANWFYNHNPEEGTPEYQTQQLLVKGKDWITK